MNMRRAIETAIEADIRRQKALGSKKSQFGHYWEIVNGVLVRTGELVDVTGNAQPTQGVNNMLDTWLGATAKPAGWYVTLYANAINPASGWTASNFASTAGEITSNTEGFTEATRPQFVPNPAASGVIDSVGTEAAFTIITATELLVEGIAILSSNVRGGTGGVLGSAARYTSTRHLNNGDDYRAGFRVTVTG
jgi:hypothetical protein